MPEIELVPSPLGHWMMMCSCGATEIRSPKGPNWTSFELRSLDETSYRITCGSCGRMTQRYSSKAGEVGNRPE